MPRDGTLVSPPPPEIAPVGIAQRMFDVTVAATALLLLAPVMALIALAVLCEGGRPILFVQTRLGAGGVPFRLYKFRKFPVANGNSGTAVTLPRDRRLTRVGALLARSKLDELPQLWNVLAGDMCIVGPRPEAMAFADCFSDSYRAVLAFRPGLFGPNQVLLRNESALYEGQRDPEAFYRNALFPLKAAVDLAYFPHRSMRRDIGWLARGVLAVCGCATTARHGADVMAQIERWMRHQGVQALPTGN